MEELKKKKNRTNRSRIELTEEEPTMEKEEPTEEEEYREKEDLKRNRRSIEVLSFFQLLHFIYCEFCEFSWKTD